MRSTDYSSNAVGITANAGWPDTVPTRCSMCRATIRKRSVPSRTMSMLLTPKDACNGTCLEDD